jgi:OmpA-OmpF porin, OOP family
MNFMILNIKNILNPICILVCISVIFAQNNSFSQEDLNGVWQGINIPAGKKIEQGTIIFLNLSIEGDQVEGQSREEYYNTKFFAIKKLKGTVKNKIVSVNQYVIEKKVTKSALTWCLLKMELQYNDSTGYLEGKYTSSDCRRSSGRIIFYRSNAKFSDNEEFMLSQHWINIFKKDLTLGYNAPQIREIERANFQFKPIYFDYDKDSLKPEFEQFLIDMIRIVNGHTDLRILVTGHTDSDGTNEYNDDLSLRRAKTITEFFTSHGLDKERIQIEFKGENDPIDTNQTPEGKQKNRRVDFSFI